MSSSLQFRFINEFRDFIDLEHALRRFEIRRRVRLVDSYPFATGSRGDVYEGYLDDYKVAVKVVRGHGAVSGSEVQAKKRLIRELFLWSRLNHENIAPFYGLTCHPAHPIPGIVSLFIQHSLLDYAADHPSAKGRLLREIAVGTAYLHSEFVIHGDMKPDNVRVSPNGQVKIIDLGMGKLENVQGFTSMWGPNPRYTAPELLGVEGGIRPTFKTDVYSFAMMTLPVLHGPDPDPTYNFDASLPFNEVKSNAISITLRLCELVRRGRRPRQTGYRNITQEQWDFLEHCWDQDPRNRPGMDYIVTQFPFEPYPP